MTNITYTPAQAAAIVAKWNELANDANQLEADQAHLAISDENFDADIISDGYATIEVGQFASKTGTPVTFIIEDTDLTIEETE